MIYFIQRPEGGPIKIGTTIGVSHRLRELRQQRGTNLIVLAVMNGSYKLESYLHKQFAHLRVQGEWFHPNVKLTDFIKKYGREWKSENPLPVISRSKINVRLTIDQELWDWLKDIEKKTLAKPSAIANKILREKLGLNIPREA